MMKKRGFYRKLAWTGIRKNSKLYTPYLLTCIGMVMMSYIMSFLGGSPVLESMAGGEVMRSLMNMGYGIMTVFSVIFLFYTNSFLIRRRKKEFGLYNVLGMGKGNLALVLLWEDLIVAAISLGIGLAAGILLSKSAELAMVKILHGAADFSLSVAPDSILKVLTQFAVIFGLILANTLRQIQMTNPIELLHSENAGEKPPKANWFLALLGAAVLGMAYYLAVTIEDPVSALIWFFVAVVMVIAATYLLFIAGSVAVCRLLQKNKKYYYKTSHFVSVSSMTYRMKRNGAGLASICILCTMVLVMLSSTVCLYIGAEDSMRVRYPRNINLDLSAESAEALNQESMESVRALAAQCAAAEGTAPENVTDYRSAEFGGLIQNGNISTDPEDMNSFQVDNYSDLWQIFVIPLEDYNRLMGEQVSLDPGETLIYTTKEAAYEADTVTVNGGVSLNVAGRAEDFIENGVDVMQVMPSLYLFVPDYDQVVASLFSSGVWESGQMGLHWIYAFDLDSSDEVQIRIYDAVGNGLTQLQSSGGLNGVSVQCESVAQERQSFYELYGSLFFLGILLGIVFLFAAVLIIYYKQISEGYEDQSRFEIMQKVGMTKREIRKSINSQVLTVFFLPLVTAGIHLAFAFPLIRKLLILFGLMNTRLLILVTLGCYLVFALFYVLVYRGTSRAYYSIVSGAARE